MTTRLNPKYGIPPAQGLYHPAHEHDACGIGFVASISGTKSHDIIEKGIQVLLNLAHRGACGCDPETGDGAGVLIQIPHKFFARECEKLGFKLPKAGSYGIGMVFLPVEKHPRLQCEGILERIVREEGLTLLGWRDTPVYASAIGRVARASQPYIQQIFIGCPAGMDEDAFERKLYVVRKRTENEVRESGMEDAEMFYIPSLSCRTIVYKGLLLAPQIANFYRELSDPGRCERALPRTPAVLDEYLSQLAAGPSVSLYRAQRRDQHAARQCELDACAAVAAEVAAVWR